MLLWQFTVAAGAATLVDPEKTLDCGFPHGLFLMPSIATDYQTKDMPQCNTEAPQLLQVVLVLFQGISVLQC